MRRGGGGTPPPAVEHGSHRGPDVACTRRYPAGTDGAVGQLLVGQAGTEPVPLSAPAGTMLVLVGGRVCCSPTSVNKE